MEGEDKEQRLWLVEEIVRRTLGREAEIRGVVKRRGEGGRWILIMEMEKMRDKEEILETGVEEVRRFWKVGMDEDLSMEKRRRRWKMVEAAKRKRARGRKVESITGRCGSMARDGFGIESMEAGWMKWNRRMAETEKGGGWMKTAGGEERAEWREWED